MADAKLTALSELSIPSLDDLAYIVDDPAGTPASYKVAQNRLGGMYSPATCQGRLTTESGVPISTSDRTAQSTIYFTPYLGDRVALYDGTRWKLYAFTERSLALSGLTASLPYDVCLYDNAGTLTLELTAWTNATTRATGLTTQDGVSVKTGATTRRYVGTIYTTGTTTTADAVAQRFVWNVANQVPRRLLVTEATDSWTYNVATWRPLNNTTANRVQYVVGLAGGLVRLDVSVLTQPLGSSAGAAGVGLDTTTANSAALKMALYNSNALACNIPATSAYAEPSAVGYHFLQLVETATNGTLTFFGDAGAPNDIQSGGIGWLLG